MDDNEKTDALLVLLPCSQPLPTRLDISDAANVDQLHQPVPPGFFPGWLRALPFAAPGSLHVVVFGANSCLLLEVQQPRFHGDHTDESSR
jgi:hypothetical protein